MAQLELNALDRDAANWLTAAIAEVGDAVLGVDIKGVIQFVNPAAEALDCQSHGCREFRRLDPAFRS